VFGVLLPLRSRGNVPKGQRGCILNRRELIRLAALSAGLQAISYKAYSQVTFRDNPFKLGIASGAPTPDGVVLWTKLSIGFSDLPIVVRYEVAHDEAFTRMAQTGTAVALPTLGHSVHAELRGLATDRWYFYRFIVGSGASAQMSDVGRTRTAPALGAEVSKLRFAFASCQNWDHGYYATYRQMVQDNPDLVVFLGDYIYEYASPKNPNPNYPRRNNLRTATTLADYRDRYALYKSDPLLQAAHRACPWIMTWDDHEVQNDYASDRGEDLASPQDFLTRRAAAYQAFYEHLPLPASALVRGLAGLSESGQNNCVRVNQRTPWGNLANFHLLDCRQYRDYQACQKPNRGGSGMVKASECTELQDPNRSMLGKPQEAWLAEGIALDAKQGVASQTLPWSVIAQSTLLAKINSPADKEPRIWTDGWEGYPFARRRLLDSMQAQPSLHPIILSGDVHLNVVAQVEGVATEFCGTSLTSNTGWHPEREPSFYQDNPHVQYFNSEKRGYALAEVTPKLWTTTLMGVEDVRREDSKVTPMAKFAVERGNKTPAKM
jgi:alkaline phosphatase D